MSRAGSFFVLAIVFAASDIPVLAGIMLLLSGVLCFVKE